MEKLNQRGSDELLSKVKEEFGDDYLWNLPKEKHFNHEEVCWYCREKLLDPKYTLIPAGRSIAEDQEEEVFCVHLSCHMGEGMRGIAQEARSARGLFEKEMRSIRQVLKAYYKNPNFYPEDHVDYFKPPEDYILHDETEFSSFLWNIYTIWSSTTDVNAAFHPVYWSYLKEYALAILEFRTLGEIRKNTILKKLRKHISDESKVQSVFEQFIQNYSQSLSDTGKTATNPAIFSRVSKSSDSTSEGNQANESTDQPVATSTIFHAVVTHYDEETKLDITNQISEAFRAGYQVVLDVSKLGPDARQRLMDYCSGLIYFARGEILQLSPTVYLLLPENASLIRMK